MNKPCYQCDDDYPLNGGVLLGRDEAWANGWHTHKREGYDGYIVFKGDIGEALSEATKGQPNFPWEEGYEALWDGEGNAKFGVKGITDD